MSRCVVKSLPGVSYKAHKTRMHGSIKDQHFFIHYNPNETAMIEAVGWASDGWTVTKAHWLLRALKLKIRKGTGPQSLEAWREADGVLIASTITFEWYQPWYQEIKKMGSSITQLLFLGICLSIC
jgi:hypothetical protein